MLFDFLVVGQVIPTNPASSVRGPKHAVRTGKTPALSAEQARELLDSISGDSIAGMRDRALIAVMCLSFARVGGMDAQRALDSSDGRGIPASHVMARLRQRFPSSRCAVHSQQIRVVIKSFDYRDTAHESAASMA
jgi:site-specific recombinase XerC